MDSFDMEIVQLFKYKIYKSGHLVQHKLGVWCETATGLLPLAGTIFLQTESWQHGVMWGAGGNRKGGTQAGNTSLRTD